MDNVDDIGTVITESHVKSSHFTSQHYRRLHELAWKEQNFAHCPPYLACPLNPNPSSFDSLQKWEELHDTFTPIIQSIVEFAKGIPGFELLCPDDKVTLLKAGTVEVLFVQMSCLFDSKTSTMIFTNGQLYKRSQNNSSSLLDSTFTFADNLNNMKLSDNEIALFCARVLISPNRRHLRNAKQVEKISERIIAALSSSAEKTRMEAENFINKLMTMIYDLEALNSAHSLKMNKPREKSPEPQRRYSMPFLSISKNESPPTGERRNTFSVNRGNESNEKKSALRTALSSPPLSSVKESLLLDKELKEKMCTATVTPLALLASNMPSSTILLQHYQQQMANVDTQFPIITDQ